MTLARREFLHLATGAALLAAPGHSAWAETPHPLADRLAGYADRIGFSDLDAATVERVKSHLIDTLGCGIAALDEPPVRICRDVALGSAGGASTVIGAGKRSSPELASFANGTAFRYFDLNDSYASPTAGTVHPSDHFAPCLAVAEAERASGQQLIAAIVLAYEINCRLIDAFDAATRGWDAPVYSLPAVALAAGKLMKLPPEKLAQAVNLALNDHIPMGQTRTQTNSDWKGLADAEAWLKGMRPDAPPEETGFAIELDGAGYIGNVGLHRDVKTPTIGYWLGEPYWHRGLMTEAVTAVIAWYFGTTNTEKIYCGAFYFNKASLAVQKKLGFVETGTSRRHCLARGEQVRHIDTELSRTDWVGSTP